MTILYLGDTHIGNHVWSGGEMVAGINTRCRMILDAIEDTVIWARDNEAVTHVVQVGDFFDHCRPSGAVIDAAIRMIQRTRVEWHILRGNHDMAGFDSPSALAPLAHIDDVTTYEKITHAQIDGVHHVMVPYVSHSAHEAFTAARAALDAMPVSPWEDADFIHLVSHYHVALNDSGILRSDSTTLATLDQMFKPVLGAMYRSISGHEHGNRYQTHTAHTGLGSFGNHSFADCGPSLAVIAEHFPPSQFVALGGIPRRNEVRFVDLTTWRNHYMAILSVVLGAQTSRMFVRCTPEQAPVCEALKSVGIIQNYKVHFEPTISEPLPEASASQSLNPVDAIARALSKMTKSSVDWQAVSDSALRIMSEVSGDN